ncbi:MAG TPA: exosortase/archaeosortase family protein [Kiritimatiellia bacterium]|nr:exosortase/archaeosortase family protein [Kiritimatiellia bacterium]
MSEHPSPSQNDTGGADVWNAKLRLATLNRSDLIQCGLVAVILAMIFFLFHFQGNTTDVRAFGRSALLWMVERWTDDISHGGDYSHGWLIPIASLAVVYWKRREIAAAPKSISRIGLMVVILGLLMHWMGAKAQQTRFSLFALIVLLWGIPFYLYGWKVAKILIFPAAFLIFCIPMNFLDTITFPLRIFATMTAGGLLNGIGIPVERVGSGLHFLTEGAMQLDVADPCSGIQSLMALTSITAIYAYFTQGTLFKKWLLFLCAIPLAVFANIIRVTTIAIVAEAFGMELALGLYHDWSGFIVFAVAISSMMALGTLINIDYREFKNRWKYALLSPT